MAKKDAASENRQKGKFAAMEALRARPGFPVPPREAMSRAKKRSKKLAYPLAPYPTANMLQLLRWGYMEWQTLGRWRNVAGPVALLVALLTWEKERAHQEVLLGQVDKAEAKKHAAEIYGAYGRRPRKRKLLGIIPLP